MPLRLLKSRLHAIFLCAVLEVGALSGVPMPPEKIRTLLESMNQPQLAHVLPADDENADDTS